MDGLKLEKSVGLDSFLYWMVLSTLIFPWLLQCSEIYVPCKKWRPMLVKLYNVEVDC